MKIVRCKKCGQNSKIVDLNKYLCSIYCSNCGFIIQQGKHDARYNWYKAYLLSEHWKTTSRLAKEHYENICHDCESKKRIEVHHLNYDRIGEERLSDLMLLCHKCHQKINKQAD